MNKSQRLVEMLLTLNTRQKFTLQELATRFGVSKRTVLRDLDELSLLGVPLYAETGVHGGYRVLKDRTLPPISFTEKEAVALFFASQSLQYYRALPLESDWQAALAKVRHVVPEDVLRRLETLQQRLLFWVPEQSWEAPHLTDLLDAALEQKVLTISYESEHGLGERDVQLVGLYAMNGKWYCPAYDFSSESYRMFRADRIYSVAESPSLSRKQDHAKLTITDWFQKEKEQEKQRETFTLKVRLTRRGVLLCRADAWLASGMTVMEDGTGRIERSMSASYMPWAASFFLGCRTDAVVEQPPELLRLIRDQLRELASIYGEGKSE